MLSAREVAIRAYQGMVLMETYPADIRDHPLRRYSGLIYLGMIVSR